MKNFFVKLISFVLCMSMILPLIPIQGVFAAADPIEIQAEDTSYTHVYRYNNIGQYTIGGISGLHKANWSSWETLQTRTYFDKSNTPYVSFQVEAPADGSYSVQVNYQFGELLEGEHFAALVVNEGGAGNVYKAKHSSTGATGSMSLTEAVNVNLKKGINTIYCIGITREQFVSDALKKWNSWCDIDKFVLDGRLTAVKKNEVFLNSCNSPFMNIYNDVDDSQGYLAAGSTSAASSEKISIADLSNKDKLAKVPSYSYTVYAEKDGYYNITLDLVGDPLDRKPDAVGLVVDGKVHTKIFDRHIDCNTTQHGITVNWMSKGYHKADLSVYLSAGNHTLTITCMLPVDAADAESYKYGWTDLGGITLHGGLKRAEIQIDPLSGKQELEAENTNYVYFNRFNTTTTSIVNYHNFAHLDHGNPYDNPTLEELRANGLDKSTASHYTIYVEAPADGNYFIQTRAMVRNSNLWVNNAWTTRPYFTFLVNGKDVYTANFTGNNDWVSNSEGIHVALKKGVNEISIVPLIKDLYHASNCWVNPDCIYLDGKLKIVTNKSYTMQTVEGEDTDYASWNKYSSAGSNPNASGGKYLENAWGLNNVDISNLKSGVNLNQTAYVSFTVNAPSEGYYRLASKYAFHTDALSNGADLAGEKPYMVFFINGQTVVKSTFLGKNDWISSSAEVQVPLKKGNNTIVCIPLTAEQEKTFAPNGNGIWANFDCLMIDPNLEAVKTTSGGAVTTIKEYQAEDTEHLAWNIYSKLETAGHTVHPEPNGKLVGGAYHNTNVYFKDLKKGVDLRGTAHISMTVNAPAAGDYTFGMRYLLALTGDANKAFKSTPYGVIFVNGQKAYKVNFQGKDGWVSDTDMTNVTLNKGKNVIVFIPLVQDILDWNDGKGYANMDSVYIDKQLTVEEVEEPDDTESGRNCIEAEDRFYTVWNGFNTAQEGGHTASEGLLAAGSHAGNNVYLKDLVPGVDLMNTAYLAWTLIAPEDGEYVFGLRYQPKNTAAADGTVMNPGAYAVFFVNDVDVYKANFNDKNGWIGDTENIKIKLKKGENTIICIPMIRDLYNAYGGNGWANVDCLYLEEVLVPVKAPVYERVEAENSEYNGCMPQDNRLMNEDWSSCYANDMTFENLTMKNLDNIAYVKYTVIAQKAGTYRIGLGFLVGGGWNKTTEAYIALNVNKGDFQKVHFKLGGGYERLVYVDVDLVEGENVIIATSTLREFMDMPMYPSQSGGMLLWTDHDYLLVPEGVSTVASDETPPWTGDDKANIGDSLDSVWGDTTGKDPSGDSDTPSTPSDPSVPSVPTEGTEGTEGSTPVDPSIPATDAPTAPSDPLTPYPDADGGKIGLIIGVISAAVVAVGTAVLVILLKKKKQ